MGNALRSSLSRLTAPALAMVAAVTVVAAAVGCARSHPPRPTAAPPRPAIPAATAQAQARSVIAQDATTLRWAWRVGRAETQLTAACMKNHGFTYLVPTSDPEPGAATMTVDALGSGGWATYGILPHREPPDDPGADRPAYQSTLDGPATARGALNLPDGSTVTYGTGGCAGEARTRLFGSVRGYAESAFLPTVARDQFTAYLATDGPYTEALTTWRSCMTGRHWSFDGPGAAISWLETAQLDATALSRRQVAIAGADRDCDARSGLRARRSAGLTRFTAGLPAPVLAGLDEIYAGRAQADQVARQTLAT